MDVPTQACFWNTLSSTCLCWRGLPCWVAHNQDLSAFPPIRPWLPSAQTGQGGTQACVPMPTTGLKCFVLGAFQQWHLP